MRRFARPFSFGFVVPALIGSSSAALAHGGDHSHMTIVEAASHLLSSLDHRLTIMAVVLLAAVAASALVARRIKQGRWPGTPAT